MGDRINSFEQLESWQKALALTVFIYEISRNFPKEEQFGLTSQLRRAASSIGANIAEGFGRSTSKDKVHFYTIAYGSILEVRNFVYLVDQLGYINNKQSVELLNETVILQKMLNASRRALQS